MAPQTPAPAPTGTTAGTLTSTTAEAPHAAAAADAVIAEARSRIDGLDEQLIALIKQRMGVSAEVQRARMSTGGPRLSLARENQILARYREALGRPGTDLAMLLLELSRGRA